MQKEGQLDKIVRSGPNVGRPPRPSPSPPSPFAEGGSFYPEIGYYRLLVSQLIRVNESKSQLNPNNPLICAFLEEL